MSQKTNGNTQKSAEKREDALRQYVSDMLATEKHIREAVERQQEDESVKPQAQAYQLVNRIASTMQQHVDELERQGEALQGSSTSMKDAVTSVLGTAAGLYDKVRTKQTSRMLRDDYTALSLAAISYTMLHTTSQALHDSSTATLALRHLKDITPLITEISRIIPEVVASELTEDFPNLSLGSAAESIRQTQEAWDAQHTRQAQGMG